jgi:hypothetical protein
MALWTVRGLVLGKPAPPVIYVESALVLRSSCGCPRAGSRPVGTGWPGIGESPPVPNVSPYDIAKSGLYSISVNNPAQVNSLPAMISCLQSFLTRLHVECFYFVLYEEALPGMGDRAAWSLSVRNGEAGPTRRILRPWTSGPFSAALEVGAPRPEGTSKTSACFTSAPGKTT